ncbi:hypothetical protein [Streptacidiphilus rugosus]|uniref:hypothetical protein n=1 Tax=Streptacidiphilus rugosus TaxID=405783 RepID=UPI000559CE2B|nr:hypothetical protein [Streptacidiphilus rugosus]
MTIELVCLVDGEVLVPATTLTTVLRKVAVDVSTWSGPETDPRTALALQTLLEGLADRIDVDCIEAVSEAAESP